MKEDQMDPQIQKILKDVKLKEPKREEMTDYLSKVRSKIEARENSFQLSIFPIGLAALALMLAFAGWFYFLHNAQPKEIKETIQEPVQIPAAAQLPQTVEPPVQKKAPADLSLEDEMAILEAFSEEYPAGTSDLLGDDDAAEDLIVLDEIEFAATPGAPQTSSLSS